MNPFELQTLAKKNMRRLKRNPYPGRGIIVGLDETGGNLVQVYWIMGRSKNSRNRVFGSEGARLFTEAANPSEMENPSLIIYDAMDETWLDGHMVAVVSNGDQTKRVVADFCKGESFFDMLDCYSYEPDEPNFTPRITASCFWSSFGVPPSFQMSILRKSPWSYERDHTLYGIVGVHSGLGYCITTYIGDGNPLPSFRGEPFPLPLQGDAHTIARTYRAVLNADNFVALAVKFIPRPENGLSYIVIENKYTKVG